MKKHLQCLLFIAFLPLMALAQQTVVTGSVLDGTSGEPIPDVTITIENTLLSKKSDVM